MIRSVNPPIGIMHPSYFVGKVELLNWLNELLELRLARVEETCSGAVAIQVLDYLFPEARIPMARVNWTDVGEYHYVANYKILQNAATAVACDRYIDVQKLIKGKYQDNLEFLQWLKAFFDHNQHHDAYVYDAKARRALGKTAGCPGWVNLGTTSRPTTATTTPTAKSVGLKKSPPTVNSATAPMTKKKTSEQQSSPPNDNKENASNHLHALETIRAERDEYFAKLRDIETLLESTTVPEAARDLVESITSILYGGNKKNIEHDDDDDDDGDDELD